MSLDSAAVFVIYDPGPMNGAADPARLKVARIDRLSGTVTAVGPFPGAAEVARVDAGVWVASGPVQGLAADTQWLRLLDPATLKVKRQLPLPGKLGPGNDGVPRLAASANLLWLAYGNHLYRLDPATGAVIQSRFIPGTATSIALDPSAQRLYTGIDLAPAQVSQDMVIEWDATTGSQLATGYTGGLGLGGPQLAAAAEDLWVAYATGMLGLVEHRRAADLAPLSEATGRHSNGIHVSVGGSVLWLWDAMAQVVACADPRTGTIRASVKDTLPSAIAADSGGAFLGDADGVAFLRPDPACFH